MSIKPKVLKLQYKNNYIQLDPDDIESVEMIHKFFKFMLIYLDEDLQEPKQISGEEE